MLKGAVFRTCLQVEDAVGWTRRASGGTRNRWRSIARLVDHTSKALFTQVSFEHLPAVAGLWMRTLRRDALGSVVVRKGARLQAVGSVSSNRASWAAGIRGPARGFGMRTIEGSFYPRIVGVGPTDRYG